MNENQIIGRNMKALREANSYTQEQVAAYLGINRSAYANYETGEREAPIDVLEKACNLFDLRDSPQVPSDKGLYIVMMFNWRRAVFILRGSLAPTRSIILILSASSSAVSMVSFFILPTTFPFSCNSTQSL